MVLVSNVPVETSQDLVVALVGREAGVATCVVAILAGHIVRDSLKVCLRGTRVELFCISGVVTVGTLPTVSHRRLLHHFTVHKEEQLVLDNRATQGETVGCHLILLTCARDLLAIDSIALHILVLVIDIGGTLVGVRTRLGDSVHTTTDEVGLTDIVGRNHHLQLLDGIDRDRITTTRKASVQSEVIVEVCTVNSEVCRTTVSTSKAHAVTAIRRQTGEFCDAT